MGHEIIGVIRVSGKGQAGDDLEDLERQRKAIRAIAAANPQSTIIGPVEVIGVSGSDLADTGDWDRTIAPAIERGADVAADAVDRLIRADDGDLRVLHHMLRHGRKAFLEGNTYDTTNHRDFFNLYVFAGIGGFEKQEIRRRFSGGKEAHRKRGQWVNGQNKLPLGCIYDKDAALGKWWGWDPDKAPRVRAAYEGYVHDGWSIARVAGVVGLTQSGAMHMLRNPIYKGIRTYPIRTVRTKSKENGELRIKQKNYQRDPEDIISVPVYGLEGQEPQLVSDQMWQAAQDRMSKRAKTRAKSRDEAAPELWATGYMRSAYESTPHDDLDSPDDFTPRHKLYGQSKKNRPHRYTCRCHMDKRVGAKCGLPSMQAAKINATLDRVLGDSTGPDFAVVVEAQNNARKTSQAQVNVYLVESQIGKLESKAKRINHVFIDGGMDQDTRDGKVAEIKAEIARLRETLAQVEESPEATPEDVKGISAWNPTWDGPTKRQWVQRYVDAIVIAATGVDSVAIRVPCGAGGVQVYHAEGPWKWDDVTTTSAKAAA